MTRRTGTILACLLTAFATAAERLPAAPCLEGTVEAVLEPALDADGRVLPEVADAVEIDCDLTLLPGQVVTKRLVLKGSAASGVTIDCNGATLRGEHWLTHFEHPRHTIDVRSVEDPDGVWRGAEDVTVKGCKVHGSVRVHGVATSLAQLRRMSYSPDHTRTLQAAGSKNIVFENLEIEAYGTNPFYVEDGVTRVTLTGSRLRGRSKGVAIYLDAESAENVVKDNDIGVVNAREQIAIDGSARNLIVGNRISGLDTGGIYLYRNCGEHGIIRHQGAQDNVIVDNVFYYDRYRGGTPAVWIASRQNNLPCNFYDGWPFFDDCYCDDDDVAEAPEIGSNLDHLDHAFRNVVAYNRFIAREPAELIRIHGDPSYVFGNQRVSDAGDRDSPCYVANGFPGPIVRHGETLELFDAGDGPGTTGRRLSCRDGVLSETPTLPVALQQRLRVVPFECRAEGTNRGCAGRAACPAGTNVVAVKAACNLEFGAVGAAQLAQTPWSLAGVVKRSDDAGDGVCRVGGVDVGMSGAHLRPRTREIAFSCREHDRNGGDCHVRGALACRDRGPVLEGPGGVIQQ